MKPDFQKLWDAFPTHEAYPHMVDLYTWLGGRAAQNVGGPGFPADGNTCASRLSVAFNNGGAPIGGNLAGITTLGTGTRARIIYRVSEFRTYLIRTLGQPRVDTTMPFNDEFRNMRGIIAFSVNWQDATGHIALWNGATYREPSHDSFHSYINGVNPRIRASRGEFWAL